MSGTGGLDPDAIRREIEETRERMGEPLGAIGYKADVPRRHGAAPGPRVVGLRALNHQTGEIIAAVEAGQPVVITRQRRPVAAIVPVDDARAQDVMLGAARGDATATTRADADLQSGAATPVGAVLEAMPAPPARAGAEAGPTGDAVFDALVAAVVREVARQFGLQPAAAKEAARHAPDVEERAAEVAQQKAGGD
jgi:prevent-host-death family protein